MKKSAVCGIIYDNKILLLKRNQLCRIKGWCLPGGKVDYGETFFEAVIRETYEETGIDIDIPSYAGEYPSIDNNYLCKVYYIKINKIPNIKLSPNEHVDYKWVEYDDTSEYELAGNTQKLINLIINSIN